MLSTSAKASFQCLALGSKVFSSTLYAGRGAAAAKSSLLMGFTVMGRLLCSNTAPAN